MAKSKKAVAVWSCTETGLQTGVFKIKRENVKDLTRKRYNKTLRRHTLHKAKVVTKAEK